MIRTVQCHVYPGWWEVRLEKYPGVRSVVVVPVPVVPAPPSDDPTYQDLCACVVLKAGRDYVTEEVLREFCQSLTLAPDYAELHCVVPRYFLFFDSFPGVSVMQTYRRQALRDLALQRLGLTMSPDQSFPGTSREEALSELTTGGNVK